MSRITQAVRSLYDKLRAMPGATGSGVYANKRGYHNSRNGNPSYDYSVVLPLDKQGPGDAAAAIDITCSTSDMIRYTKLAMAALDRKDPRFRSIREFIGTRDGRNVVRYTRTSRTGSPKWASSDSSHLWHFTSVSFVRTSTTETVSWGFTRSYLENRPVHQARATH